MRRAHTVAQVRAAEAEALEVLPPGTLMRRAARALAAAVLDVAGGGYGTRVCLLVGSGDNGGDALLAGADLARRGCAVHAALLTSRVHESALAEFRASGGRVLSHGQVPRGPVDVVVDGVVGIGGRPGLVLGAQQVLALLDETSPDAAVVAVDVPSGVDVDTGETPASFLQADVTVTFGTHKVAHLVDPAARACGTVRLVDIGLELPGADVEALEADDVAALLPVPATTAHKYTRGVVGVRAGSVDYPGAGVLATAGASTGLCGMVRYVGDAADEVLLRHPEVVPGVGRVQAWAIGSGLSGDARLALAEVVALAREDGAAVVVDAGALAPLAEIRTSLGVPAVLTPHAGELAAMTGEDRARIEAHPLAAVREAAVRYDAVVLLKGPHTLVADPSGRVRVTTTGTPWLASAGAGDVLTGLVGALLAAGLEPFDAASVGSWLHGAAASRASAGGPLVAADLPDAVVAVVRDLLAR